jgi:predicted ATP-grasp superfamily ATP-dependent carboligase
LPADSETLLDRLVDFARAESAPPILYYAEPESLLFASRNREALRKHFRFVIAEADLIEDIEDKNRFTRLAERFDLPVPSSVVVRHGSHVEAGDIELPFPLLMKPLARGSSLQWLPGLDRRKAVKVESNHELTALLPRVHEARIDVILQKYISGPESRIESYHVYVDTDGEVVGEFTGRKIRTWPAHYGHSTALETTRASDVRVLGRSIVGRVGLTGVAKLDFKRDRDGRLFLLEINPRFNLWHNLGAAAGVNLPGLVWADLNDLPRPSSAVVVQSGEVWCHLVDYLAARKAGMSLLAWLRFLNTATVKSSVSLRDPKLTAVYLAKRLRRARRDLRPESTGP